MITIEDIKKKNASTGNHWFSKDTIRFFNSIVYDKVYNGCFFITSEDFFGNRKFTIRKALENGGIDSVSAFGAYETYNEACAAIEELSKLSAL
jgi:hypothetical protein